MGFITDDFMLQNDVARFLYHTYAKDMPIFDYHCHLDPKQIAEDYHFEDPTELWLGGDHYKWRAERAMGLSENVITGEATSKEKFAAWAETVPNTIGNPLFHWTALELKRYFDIDEILNSENWENVYKKMKNILVNKNISTRKLIKDSNVKFIGTTDNPYDTLEYHKQIAEDDSFDVVVAPSFRPDEAFAVGEKKFIVFLEKMKNSNGKNIDSFSDLISSLEDRIQFFKSHGAKASDHGLGKLVYRPVTDEEANMIFNKALNEEEISLDEYGKFQTALLRHLGRIYKENDFVMQIHFGAIRNNQERIFNTIGPDVGVDSINDQINVAESLNGLLNEMDKTNDLPKTILYPLNSAYFDVAATAAANFQSNDEGIQSKIQLGSGWWFNDTKYGMLKQFKSASEAGLLMHFVGMLTDSRSFISYTRHEYFRRLFCDYIGDLVEKGEIPNDEVLLERLIKGVCYENSIQYFNFSE